jgi:hypothetical protein
MMLNKIILCDSEERVDRLAKDLLAAYFWSDKARLSSVLLRELQDLPPGKIVAIARTWPLKLFPLLVTITNEFTIGDLLRGDLSKEQIIQLFKSASPKSRESMIRAANKEQQALLAQYILINDVGTKNFPVMLECIQDEEFKKILTMAVETRNLFRVLPGINTEERMLLFLDQIGPNEIKKGFYKRPAARIPGITASLFLKHASPDQITALAGYLDHKAAKILLSKASAKQADLLRSGFDRREYLYVDEL